MDFNPGFSIRTLYHALPTCDILVQFINKYILEITKEEINAFVPDQDEQKTNTGNFINLIRTMANSRQEKIIMYTHVISKTCNVLGRLIQYLLPISSYHQKSLNNQHHQHPVIQILTFNIIYLHCEIHLLI